MKFKTIFEDNQIIVVEKPVNMLTQSDSTGDNDLLSEIKAYIKEKDSKPGNVFIGMVHRLDRPVGGVMVFAKTSKAASRISNQIKANTLEKKYMAVMEGKFDATEGELTNFLVKDSKTNKTTVFDFEVANSKESILKYWVHEYNEKANLSLVEVELVTGRSHQIRAQFSHINHPLVGDVKYGGKKDKANQDEGIALWAYFIGFEHPVSKDFLEYTSNPPKNYPWDLFEVSE
jgi:23S rRNA pseudouridine1911/1915/1917 synthase